MAILPALESGNIPGMKPAATGIKPKSVCFEKNRRFAIKPPF
jgi:hypothetical protein